MTQMAFVLAGWLCTLGCGDSDTRTAERAAVTPTADTAAVCDLAQAEMPLPDQVRESSGLAPSARDGSVLWTHNDAGNNPDIFAVGSDGRLIARVSVSGADLIDWEDIESAPCGSDSCIYVADIGDNDNERESITVYRVVEPAFDARETAPAGATRARFPDGPRDAEAMFADGAGTLYIVNKGDRDDIALYRWPSPEWQGETVALERVRVLFPEPEHDDDRVTAASMSPDRRWVGIRTYRSLHFYRTAELLGNGAAEPITIDLSELDEPQGEALAFGENGEVWLSSEAARRRQSPRRSLLRCTLPS